MNITRETFDKSERLCSRKIIGELFENGNIFYNSLFKVVWDSKQTSLPGPVQIAFSVSKRGFKLAVTRNLIKRRLREAYRKNKIPLYHHLISRNIKVAWVVIIRGRTVPDYETIEKTMKETINKLIILTSQKSEVRSQKTDDGRQKSEDGNRKPDEKH